MRKIVDFFIENHKLTIILTVMVVIFGLFGLMQIRAESYPNVNFAFAQIETRYEGASAKDVETKVTKPIEDKIREVSGLKDVRSVSKTGFSSIFVRVDMDNEDEDEVLDELQKAVDSVANLPEDLKEEPTYLEVNSEEFPAIEMVVVGENGKRERDLIVDELKEELEDIKMIKAVRLVGFHKRQFNIRLKPDQLRRYHIGVSEVIGKIRSRNVDIPGGKLKRETEQDLIRVEAKVRSASDLAEMVIRSNFSGEKIRLKDIATIEDGKNDLNVMASFNGQEATILVVNKKAGSDTLALVDEVNEVLKRFEAKFGETHQIMVYNNEANKVKAKLDILSSNAFSGLVIVIVFLFIFLPGKIGLMASFSLPLSIMATFGFMPSMGVNLDAISILALVIALGMLVDNSVVISENFSRLHNEEGIPAIDAAKQSVYQLWLPISATAFTTIAAFLPMLVTKGIMGQFIKYIPIIVSLALVLSLAESFFFLPLRLSRAGKKHRVHGEDDHRDWFHQFSDKFEVMMRWCVRRRYLMFLIFGGFIFTAFGFMIVGNKFILFPSNQVEIYVGRLELPRGTTLETTDVEVQRLTTEIKSELGDWQRDVVGRAGISRMGSTDPKGATGPNQGLLLIYATDYAKYNVESPDFLEKIRQIKSPTANFLTFEAMVNGPPVGEPINVTFRSNNAESLESFVNEMITKLSSVEGVFDVKSDDILGEKEYKVQINYSLADRLGIQVNELGQTLRSALSGNVVSKVTLDNKEVDLHLRMDDTKRKVVSDISSIEIMDGRGNLIPLSNVANIEESNGSYEIKRFDFKRSKTITGLVNEKIITSPEANLIVVAEYELLNKKYPDVSMVFGGEAENTKESMESLGQALVLSLMGIFGLLVFLFNSYIRPFIIMTTIPLGLIGFSIAFYFHQEPISFLAMIGIIGLGGIIVNSGIVLISFIDTMRAEGKMELGEILAKASSLRLRAVLVTSLTTIAGLLPTAYGIGGSDAMLIPMTLAMAWGLTSGTLLTLVWVPCAYAISEDWANFSGRFLRRGRSE